MRDYGEFDLEVDVVIIAMVGHHDIERERARLWILAWY